MGTKARMTAEFRAEMQARRERQTANDKYLIEDLKRTALTKTLRAERKERERMKERGEVYGPPNPYKPHRSR